MRSINIKNQKKLSFSKEFRKNLQKVQNLKKPRMCRNFGTFSIFSKIFRPDLYSRTQKKTCNYIYIMLYWFS